MTNTPTAVRRIDEITPGTVLALNGGPFTVESVKPAPGMDVIAAPANRDPEPYAVSGVNGDGEAWTMYHDGSLEMLVDLIASGFGNAYGIRRDAADGGAWMVLDAAGTEVAPRQPERLTSREAVALITACRP